MKSRRKAKLSDTEGKLPPSSPAFIISPPSRPSRLKNYFTTIPVPLPLLVIIALFISSIALQLSDASDVYSNTIEDDGYGYGGPALARSASPMAVMADEMEMEMEMGAAPPPPPKAAMLKSGMNMKATRASAGVSGGAAGGGGGENNLGSNFLNDLNANIEEGHQSPTPDKMLIKSGSLSLSMSYHPRENDAHLVPVPNSYATHEDVVAKIKTKIDELPNAYIESERGSSYNHYVPHQHSRRRNKDFGDDNNVKIQQLSMTLRIPAANFDDFVEQLKESSSTFGGGVEVKDSSFSVQDVTGNYIDAVSRINVLSR